MRLLCEKERNLAVFQEDAPFVTFLINQTKQTNKQKLHVCFEAHFTVLIYFFFQNKTLAVSIR